LNVAKCSFYAGATHRSQFPKDGRPEVAFLGRSNVGKSSLLNSLLRGPAVARVSGTPGRTQQLNFYLVDESFYFVDLPGYGYARAPAHVRASLTGLIEAYLTGTERLAVAILLVDSRHEPMAADRAMVAWLAARSLNLQVVLTKIDKLPRGQWRGRRDVAVREFATDDVIVYSSKTGEGRKNLWQIIHRQIVRQRDGK
jgi:GTP-binding protein